MYKRVVSVMAILFMATAAVWALMPPDVYKDRILKSPIKATVEIISVKVIKEEPAWVQKLVTCKLIKSYGLENPGKEFSVYCYSQGRQPIVGGRIYYYPQEGDKAYITAPGKNLEITSMTPLSDKLQIALDATPDKVKPGVGVVIVE